MIKVDGKLAGTMRANKPYPGQGNSGFFDYVAAIPGNRVCASTTDIGQGVEVVLGCRDMPIQFDPYGEVQNLERVGTDVRLTGWAIDPDSAEPVVFHVSRDGTPVATTVANVARPDVDAANPWYGPSHGISILVPEGPDGDHTVCVTAHNLAGPGAAKQLGCKTYQVRHNPFGEIEINRVGATVAVRGWAADPDEPTRSLDVRVLVDNAPVATVRADVDRPDVARAHPELGARHGVQVDVPAAGPGEHSVCLQAVNVGPGTDTTVGCARYVRPGPLPKPVIAPLTKAGGTLGWKQNWLSWTTDGVPVHGVRIERSVAGGPWQEVLRASNPNNPWSDQDVQPMTRYCYRLVVSNDYPSENSAEVCGVSLREPPAAPTDVRVSAVSDTSVTVAWTDNATAEDRYAVTVWVGDTHQEPKLLPANPGTGPMTYTVTGLTPSTRYRIYLAPLQDDAAAVPEELLGRVEAVTGGAPRVTSFTANQAGVNACEPAEITLTWDVIGATRVEITADGKRIFEQTKPTGERWQGSAGGGRHDGNVRYVLTASEPGGRTVTAQWTVARYQPVQLVHSFRFVNDGAAPMRIGYYDRQGKLLEDLGTLATGESKTIVPANCELRYLYVINTRTNQLYWQPNPSGLIQGYSTGPDIPVSLAQR
ncbi:fibronectin type III domain-containing protein [Micromonospora sp. NPDC092111]|uniref:fibronectin type III domain-containing protein n=1 Tax=Micromonospora sp. NPDC092111 TaxID=3364289 RepID=UPI0038116B81